MKVLVTSALPYANSEIHLGHLAGAYLPADIYVRYLRAKKIDVIYICGTDEHGVPITLAAEKEKATPQEIADRYHRSIKESFAKFGMSFDNFSQTSRPLHHKVSQEFFLKVYHKGLITPKTTKQLFCGNCRTFLADRYVEGKCPSCGAADARGDQCEACGKWLEPFDLLEPKCKTCGGTPEVRETTHWFFALSRFQKQLEDWIGDKKDWKDNVRRFCQGWFERGLEDRSITRDLTWGVKVPIPEAKDKVLYVWFDAPIGYISATIEWAAAQGKPDLWKDYWFGKDTKMVHFIGKDNIVFHAVVWPAMLMAHGDYILPAEVPANEFLNLEGRKLSSSRNWAVWLPDYLERFEPDPLRYALAVNLPENRDVDFTWADFLARNNNELADILGNFINRVALFVRKNYAGKIPEGGSPRAEELEVLNAIAEAPAKIGGMIERFELKNACRELMNLPALGNRYFDYQLPWKTFKTDRAACDRAISVCCRLISALEVLMRPFMPFSADKVKNMLGLGDRGWDEAANPVLPGEFKKVEILFHKIDDDRIAAEVARLGRPAADAQEIRKSEVLMEPTRGRFRNVTAQSGTIILPGFSDQSRPKPDPKKETKMEISFDEFKKLDLRVAQIVAAVKVEGADKLLKIEVDLGTEKRQIVAGIAPWYPPETLVGKKIILVANLAPARIRGNVSHGMMLAAEGDGQVVVLTLDKDLPAGSMVR
jgi:methionyl-tRNA synthetase